MPKNAYQEHKSKRTGVILVLLAVLFWGMSFISTKVLLREYPPVSIAFFRQFVAMIPLTAFFIKKSAFFKPDFKTVLHMSVAGFFGVVLYFVFENTGMKYISASGASIIVATIPVFTYPIEAWTGRQKVDRNGLLLILSSWLGVYLVIAPDGSQEAGTDHVKGSLLIFLAMVSWIIYTLISKRLGERYSSLQMTTVQTLLSIPLFLPFVLNEVPLWHWPSAVAAVHLAFLGVFCSALAYVFFLYGISTLGPAVSSSYLNLIPLITMTIGAAFLGERLSLPQLAGAFLILASLGLISFLKLRTHG